MDVHICEIRGISQLCLGLGSEGGEGAEWPYPQIEQERGWPAMYNSIIIYYTQYYMYNIVLYPIHNIMCTILYVYLYPQIEQERGLACWEIWGG